MQIKITGSFASIFGTFKSGELAEVPDKYATELLNAGLAEPVKQAAKKEKAVKA